MMKIYVVNLPRCRERRENILAECARFGLEPEIFPAVDGRDLTEADLRGLLADPDWNPLTPPEIGCALSHLGIYRDMVEKSIPHALILEDDSVFRRDPRPLLAGLEALPADAPDVYLLTHRNNQYFAGEQRQIGDDLFYRGWHGYGGNGYVVTLGAAENLLRFQTPIKCPCDWWKLFQRHGLVKFYVSEKEFVGLHQDLGAPSVSLIENERRDRVAMQRGYFKCLRREVPLRRRLLSLLHRIARIGHIRRTPSVRPRRETDCAVSVVMITLNEEEILPHSLSRLQWADEIIVVDSNSVDNTRAIAAAHGAKVFARAFRDFSDQSNWAMAQATGDWILIVDADELVTPELADSILRAVRANPAKDVFALRVDTILFGQMMRSSPWSNMWKLRLFRRGAVSYAGAVHQTPQIGTSRAGRLDGVLMHYTCRSTEKYFEKHQLYSTLWARKAREGGRGTTIAKALAASVWRVFHNYFIRGEIRDGAVGFACSILAGAHTFTRHMKLWGLQNAERFNYIPGDGADGADKA